MSRDPGAEERRRKERLLTFSPGEWLWVVLFVVAFVLIVWAH